MQIIRHGQLAPFTLLLLALAIAACGGSGDSGGRGLLGGTDTDVRSVSLDDVHVDTFIAGSVPLSVIEEERLLTLRDAIPPLDNPRYDDAAGGEWLQPNDLVLGYVAADGTAYAYPVKILNLHEIVNDTLTGRDVLVTYCPLCRSGIVYDRNLGEQLLSFGNTSALYEADLVMYDRQTLSYWFQVAGEAIIGEKTGARLEPLPSVTTTWSEWRLLHPQTLVLSRDTGFGRDYDREIAADIQDFVNDGVFPFPVTDAAKDGRLPAGELVLGVEAGGERRAYPIASLGDAALNDELGSTAIAILARDGGTAAAYAATVAGRTLTFERRDGAFFDAETGSEWLLTGEAVAGELAGERLPALPVRTTLWFAYAAAFPAVEVYEP